MGKIRNLTEQSTYDPAFSVPAQKPDGTTRRIPLPALSPTQNGASGWEFRSASFAAVAGGQYWIDATAGDIVAILPTNPLPGQTIWLWRLDTTSNKVLARPGTNKINKLSGKDGVLAPAAIDRVEALTYINATIGWLGQFGLLTYQNAVAKTLVLDLLFEGANGSTTFVDETSNSTAISALGSSAISTARFASGNSSLLNGAGLEITSAVGDPKYNLAGDFEIAADVYFTSTTGTQILLGRTSAVSGRKEYALYLYSPTQIALYYGIRGASANTYLFTFGSIAANQWNAVKLSRTNDSIICTLNNVAATENGSYSSPDSFGQADCPLWVGVFHDGTSPLIGNIDNLKLYTTI